jgi:hypothetical protein
LRDVPSPKPNELQEVVARVFKEAALIDTGYTPNYFCGDFNGDLSEDIAVIVKSAPGKLSEMNEEFPTWILKDARVAPDLVGPHRLRVDQDEKLLAVIHGYGSDGWRDPQATQTYLLKNAVGSDIRVQPGKAFLAANKGKKLPSVHGDLIGQVLGGTPGYLYYARTTYGWYDPKTFAGAPEVGPFHGRAAGEATKAPAAPSN